MSFLVSFISAAGSLKIQYFQRPQHISYTDLPCKLQTCLDQLPNLFCFVISTRTPRAHCHPADYIVGVSQELATQVTRLPFSAALSHGLDQLQLLLLTDVSEFLKLRNSKKLGHAQLLHEPPVISILRKDKPRPSILEVLSRTKLRPRGEIKLLLLEDLSRHRRAGDHNTLRSTKTDLHEWTILPSYALE